MKVYKKSSALFKILHETKCSLCLCGLKTTFAKSKSSMAINGQQYKEIINKLTAYNAT
jgi:hypothetical protein